MIFILVFSFIFGTLRLPCTRGACIVRQKVDKEPKTDLTQKNKEAQKNVYFYFRVQKDIQNAKNVKKKKKTIASLGNSVICW